METDPLSPSTKCDRLEADDSINYSKEDARKSKVKYDQKKDSPGPDLLDFICFVCNNEFDDMAKLHVHMSLKHKGIKVWRPVNHFTTSCILTSHFPFTSHTDANTVVAVLQLRKVFVYICSYIILVAMINTFVYCAKNISFELMNCTTIMQLSTRKPTSVANAANVLPK